MRDRPAARGRTVLRDGAGRRRGAARRDAVHLRRQLALRRAHRASERRLQSARSRVLAESPRHRADDERFDVPRRSTGSGDTPLRRHVAHTRAWYDWVADESGPSPLIERGFAWLDDALAERRGAEPVVSWGDCAHRQRPCTATSTPVAVLDWEMAGLGPRELDLAWLVYATGCSRTSPGSIGIAGLPDFMRPDDVVAEYEQTQRLHAARSRLLRHVRRRSSGRSCSCAPARRSVHFGEQEMPDERRRLHRQPRRPRSDARRHLLDLRTHDRCSLPHSTSTRSTRRRCRCATSPTSDRNFYDRCYFNAHDRTGDIFFVTGLGVYPNLGVIDAYATVRKGDHQWAIRCSDALGGPQPRSSPSVRTASRCSEPLQRVRLVCDGDGARPRLRPHVGGLVRRGDGAAPRHAHRRPRAILDAARFAQVGTWEGTLPVDGEEITRSSPDAGSAPATVRGASARRRGRAAGPQRRRAPRGLLVAVRAAALRRLRGRPHRAGAARRLPHAQRRHPRVGATAASSSSAGPRSRSSTESGTRHPERAVLHLASRAAASRSTSRSRRSGRSSLHVGVRATAAIPTGRTGSGADANFVEGAVYDLTDPAIVARIPFGVIDHVGHGHHATARKDWGLFEHGTMGRHDPSGFADWGSVAP